MLAVVPEMGKGWKAYLWARHRRRLDERGERDEKGREGRQKHRRLHSERVEEQSSRVVVQ